ncbi:centrosomal protein of 104 kDa [Agrilus planipennis]|uniref:Centrosomal protein of 104 kDa n=1 Tax=Agrilus planipennis TaxID=224129 RepID=A0A7F5RA48_AGRPL|nr:centrosomal protein of 104 kDa [Agrilus planipennis]
MPKKIKYNVIFTTGEDQKYKSSELNSHGPTVRGWQSPKNCDYPQEIVLKLAKQYIVTKIQMLTHQFLIPSKVELYASNQDTNTVDNISNIKWEYLGYVTLSDNQSTDFKCRELKSVNVPSAIASFLKLKLGINHKNFHNVYNQVSLIAVNVLGLQLENKKPSNHCELSENEKLENLFNDPEYSSIYDDLAFEMYVDTEVASIIKNMEIKKHLAVINERFEYARKLKKAMEELRIGGEKLGKYELEKRHAIEMEDYEKARLKKNQSDDFRADLYKNLNINELLEIEGVCPKNDECLEDVDSAKKSVSPTQMKIVAERQSSSPNTSHIYHGPVSPLHGNRNHQSPKNSSPSTGSPTSLQSKGSFRRRNKSAGSIVKSTYEQYEEKPLPALRHSQTNEFLRECQLDYDYKPTSKLTEREKKQAALPILVFGVDLVENFYSKQYLDKEEGLNRLKEELLAYDHTKMHTANKTARAAIFLLHRALRDKVFTIYNLANEVIRLFFIQFVPERVSSAEVARSVDKLLPELLTKSGDTSTRINHMAVHTILTMADCSSVRELHIIPIHLSRPLSSSTHPRLALSRAEMVEQLIINHGISTEKNSGLTCRTLAEFGSSGLHHPAEAVRKVAERILVLVYRVNPRLVRKQLPPDDDITRRNLLYRQLFQEFDKIDLQRKKEQLERTRLIQQCAANSTCLSPEPIIDVNSLNKSASSKNIVAAATEFENNVLISKSLSGGNLVQNSEKTKADIVEKSSNSSISGVSTPSNHSNQEDTEKQCIFCHQPETEILNINKSLNSHYWRSCPMLIRCQECSQVIEVATLCEHLIMDCEQREHYTQCSQCTEAVKVANFETHSKECSELTEACNRCPLCHANLEDQEEIWRKHLMGDNPCPMNKRIKNQGKQVTIQF